MANNQCSNDSAVDVIQNVAVGAGVAVAAVTALPIAGAVGTVTAVGAISASVVGGVAGLFDCIFGD